MFIRVKEAKEKVSPYFIKESGKNRGSVSALSLEISLSSQL
jgi:hypothetical protein